MPVSSAGVLLYRVAWLSIEDARVKLLKGQRIFLDRLLDQTG